MKGLRILITNNTLAGRAGTELYVRDLATALLDRGHSPIAYSPALGEVATDVRRATIPVVDDLSALGQPPDLIHGHHHIETMTALLHFPGVPAIYVCHGWLPWEEAPPRFPRIRRYVAVDDVCRDRLVLEHGVPPGQVSLVPNFVDLDRFQPRPRLPGRPARALVFSNQATEASVVPIRQACEAAGIALDVAGLQCGNRLSAPETVLGRYDVVFAKGRAALEGLAVGTAVILCDTVGLGGIVTTADLGRLRRLNFGIRTLRAPVEPAAVARELARYDPVDAAEVSRRIRASAGRDTAVDAMVALYREVVAEHAEPDVDAEYRAAAAYLRWLSRALKELSSVIGLQHLRTERAGLVTELESVQAAAARQAAERDALRDDRDRLAAERAALRDDRDRLTAERDALRDDRDRLTAERDALRVQYAALSDTLTVRMRARLLRAPLVVPALRALGRAPRRRLE